MDRIREFISNFLFITALSIIFGISGYKLMVQQEEIIIDGLDEIKIYESYYKRNIPEIEVNEESIIYTNGDFIGTISFLENTLPLYYGHDESVLELGAAIEDRVLDIPGRGTNSVIYGHREQHFWDLQFLSEGDLISISLEDKELKYEVYLIEVMNPKDIEIYSENDSNIITLVTCYPFIWMGKVTDRYIIKAKLIE